MITIHITGPQAEGKTIIAKVIQKKLAQLGIPSERTSDSFADGDYLRFSIPAEQYDSILDDLAVNNPAPK